MAGNLYSIPGIWRASGGEQPENNLSFFSQYQNVVIKIGGCLPLDRKRDNITILLQKVAENISFALTKTN